MQSFFEKMDGQVKVASAFELESLTVQGWKLVFCFQDTTQMACAETEAGPPNSNGYAPPTIGTTKYKPNTETKFVLHKGESKVLEELNAQLEAERQQRTWAEASVSTMGGEVAKWKKAAEEQERFSKQHAEEKTKAQTERDRFRGLANKLEADLAKVRTAIGVLHFNQILPPPPSPDGKS